MEFNIIERTPKKINRYTQKYTYTYQMNGESTKHKVQLLYIKSMEQKWFFIAGDKPDPIFDKDNNKEKFIEEIKKWQKGGSYRKLNPTVKSTVDNLKSKRKELEHSIRDIDEEIKKVEKEEREKIAKEYMSDFSDKEVASLNKLRNNVEKYLNGENSRYMIQIRYYNDTPKLFLFDKEKQKYRYVVWLYSDRISFSELDDEMIKMFIK